MATSLLRQDIVDLVNQQPFGAAMTPRAPALTPDDRDALAATGMTSLRRGFESGRLGVDANTAYSDEASLRAAGRNAEADLLRQAALGSQRRAGIFAPEVGRVEDIDGASSGLSWAAGQLGQGAASMLDPMAAAAGVTALGTGLSFVPNPVAKGAGMLLRNVAAPGAAYGINVDQLKGEHYGNISADPEVMATRTPQELNQQATMYGLGAGALDTLLPAAAGRALGGAAVLAKPRMSPASKLLGGMTVEGTTELAQGEGSRYLHTQLNPLRDTSGDASARLNEFAGGAVGGAGPSLLMAGADAGFGAMRRGGEVARETVGSTVDLAKDAASKVGEAVSKARGKTVDLAESLRQASTQKDDGRLAEVNLLRGLPDDPAVADDPAAFEAWLGETGPKRTAAVQQGLTDLADVGDPRASELLAELGQGGEAAAAALEAGAEHLIDARGLQELAAEADAALDGPRKGLAGAVGGAIGRGGRRVAGAIAEGSKALWDGLLQKRNSQWTGDQYEGEKHRAMRAFDGAGDVAQAKRQSFERAKLMGEYLAAQTRTPAQTLRWRAHRVDPDAIERRMQTLGAELSDIAESWGMYQPDTSRARGQMGEASLQARAQNAYGPRESRQQFQGPTSLLPQDGDKRMRQFSVLRMDLDRIAESIRVGVGRNGDPMRVLAELRKMADPSAAPLFDYLESAVNQTPQQEAQKRNEARDAFVATIDEPTQARLLKEGIDVRAPRAGDMLLKMVDRVARGVATPDQRAQLSKVLGKENLNRALDTFYRATPEGMALEEQYANQTEGQTTESGLQMDESGDVVEATEVSDFDKRQAEKVRPAARVYGYYGKTTPATDRSTGNDPLAYDNEKVVKAEVRKWQAEVNEMRKLGQEPDPEDDPRIKMARRPRLFNLADNADKVAEREQALLQRFGEAQTPEAMAKGLETEIAGLKAKIKAAGGTVMTGLQRMQAQAKKVREAGLVSPAMTKTVTEKARDAEGEVVSVRSEQPLVSERPNYQAAQLQTETNEAGSAAMRLERMQAELAAREKALAKVKAAMAEPDNAKAAEWLSTTTAAYFANQGGWRTRTMTGLEAISESLGVDLDEVLDEKGNLIRNERGGTTTRAGMFVNRVLSRYRDYVRQSAFRAEKSDPARYKELMEKVRFLGDVLHDRMVMAQGGARQELRVKVGERVEAWEEAKEYFATHGLVVAERMAGEDAQVVTADQLLDWARAGKKAVESGPLVDKKRIPPSDVLVFQSALADGAKSTELYVRSKDLIQHARDARAAISAPDWEDNGDSYGNQAKDREHLELLVEGITSVVSSGLVEGLPKIYNSKGQPQFFARDIPAALPLATKTYKGYRYAIEEKAKKEAEASKARSRDSKEFDAEIDQMLTAEQVAEDQSKDFFTPDDRTEVDLRAPDAPRGRDRRGARLPDAVLARLKDASRAGDQRQYAKLMAEIRETYGDEAADELLLTGVDGAVFYSRGNDNQKQRAKDVPDPMRQQPDMEMRYTVDRSGTRYPKAKTDDDFRVPSEFERQAEDEAPDEYSDQRRRSKIEGRDAGAFDRDVRSFPAIKAPQMGKEFGRKLEGLLRADFESGMAEVRLWLRQAAAPSFSERKNTPLGGPHYVAPVVEALNGGSYRQLAQTSAQLAELNAARAKAAEMLLNEKVKQPERLRLAQLLAPPEARERLTGVNVVPYLQKAAQGAAEFSLEGPPAPRARSRREEDALSTAAVEEYQADTAAAKEDAAPAGKSSRPSGAGSADGFSPARKLNAQAVQMHRELGRLGFGAAHNSPVKHEGKFDWRKHLGKGEGNWVYGAGTYLSTADGVHRYYKKFFTGEAHRKHPKVLALEDRLRELSMELGATIEPDQEARIQDKIYEVEAELDDLMQSLGVSPTYQVSVDIPPDRILAWAQPLIDQPASIRLRALKAIKDLKIEVPTAEAFDDDVYGSFKKGSPLSELTGEDLYREIADKLKPGVPFEKSAPAASDYLQSLGILGHQYPSAKRNTAEPNYVIYDDSKITTNFVAFNKQDPGNLGSMSQAEKDKVRAEVERLLGKQVQLDFKDITGYSGEWISTRNVIEISTAAGPNALSVAHHEALHAFFTKFVENDPRAKEAMVALADNQDVLKRLQALLADHPNALADLKYGEERLAYMYQFWAADMLDLPGRATTLFQKIARFFRRVLGRITDQERAVAIIEAFHRGELSEPSAAGQVIAKAMAEGTNARKLARQADAVLVKARSFVYAARGVLNTSESATAREIGHQFWTNPGEEKEGSNKEGYINAKEAVANKYKNLFAEVVGDLNPRDMRDVAKILQSTNYDADIKDVLAKIAYQPHRDAVERIHKLLKRFHDYMTHERGMKIGKLNNYFPRVWNTGLLLEKEVEFTDMLLAKYDKILADGAASSKLTKEQVARRIYQKLIDNGSADHILPKRDDGVLAPFFENAMVRELKWLQNADAEPFLSKDLVGTMTGYFHMGARAAEYTQRFGQDGELLAAKLKKVEDELRVEAQKLVDRGELKADAASKWVARRAGQIQKSVGAMEGTLGNDIGSTWRNLNTWATVYQNVRLLPLTLFSSLVDPMGLVARGAPMGEAYATFLRGMREVGASWRDMFAKEPKERQRDHWEKVAEYVGAIDSAMLSHHAAEEHSSIYMGKKAKRINDAFFRINGMEAWNRGMRVGATQAAVRFLERHAKLPDTHSERWLKELGVAPADLHFAPDGSLVTSKVDLRDSYLQQGLKPAEADAKAEVEIEKTHYAIRRWVQGAILTPNAAQRPAWSSDPHYSMFFHLKQFSYSFHQTLIKRAVNELDHGNLAPLAAFIWYIPVMVGSNIMRGLIQGGGDLPMHMQGMDLGDHVNKAIWQTIGATGAIAVDATHDLSSLAGPMVEQAIDALGQPMGRTVVDALPAKSLYAEALR